MINRIADFQAEMANRRHDLDAHPETAFTEHRTADTIARLLEKRPGSHSGSAERARPRKSGLRFQRRDPGARRQLLGRLAETLLEKPAD